MISRRLPNSEPTTEDAYPTILPMTRLQSEVLQRLQFFQGATGFNLFACHSDSLIHLAGQAGHDKSRRRIRNQQVALWPGLPPSENSHDRFSICLGIPARQFWQRSLRNPKPARVQNG